jgi:hypothetical protein
MGIGFAARSVIALCLAVLAGRAHAMQFGLEQVTATETFIGGRGPIVKGDTARLEQVLASVPTGRKLLALALDSPGGNVVEGEQLARLIRARGLPVVIPSNSQCVSACFLLVAASTRRFAASDALIGVHSANENGNETDISLAVTTLMARTASNLGIPPAIIGKMVQTTPGRVEWLTPADLAQMNVTVFDGDTATAMRKTVTANARPATPAPTPTQPLATAPPLIAALPRPPTTAPSFPLGLNTARVPVMPPITTTEPVEAEFQGAYFCGRSAARLTLKLFAPSGELQRRALFIFGPQPASPDVPRGAFLAEGSFNTSAGDMALAPVRWVTQPGGYPWFGLAGRSTDGGKTFSGRVTESSACSLFTLKRVGVGTLAR